jgi:hypothetical protein
MSEVPVSQKLQQFRKNQHQEEAADTVVKIRMMPLDVLSREKIAFGKAKIGQLFPEVFKDAAWTDWFIRTYEKSTKPEHQLYVQYVTKRLDMEIKAEHTKGYHKESRAILADQKCQAPADSEVWDQLSEPGVFTDFDMPGINKVQQMEEQVANLNIENKNLASRMAGVEMALQEVLQHLKGLNVKSEP